MQGHPSRCPGRAASGSFRQLRAARGADAGSRTELCGAARAPGASVSRARARIRAGCRSRSRGAPGPTSRISTATSSSTSSTAPARWRSATPIRSCSRPSQRQLPLLTHGLDFPTEVKDEFVSLAAVDAPRPRCAARTKIGFCGPTGANAVEAALKLCKTATGRAEIVAFQGATTAARTARWRSRRSSRRRSASPTGCPACTSSPIPYALRCALGGRRERLGAALRRVPRALAARSDRRRIRCRRR